MTEQKLENKLMEFYSHYNTLQILVEFLSIQLAEHKETNITQEQLRISINNLDYMIKEKINLLNEICQEVQERYCKD